MLRIRFWFLNYFIQYKLWIQFSNSSKILVFLKWIFFSELEGIIWETGTCMKCTSCKCIYIANIMNSLSCNIIPIKPLLCANENQCKSLSINWHFSTSLLLDTRYCSVHTTVRLDCSAAMKMHFNSGRIHN